MTLTIGLLVIASILSGAFGFAAHRGGICTVRAVAEVVTTRRAYMLACFAKIALWVALFTLAANWLLPVPDASGWGFSMQSLAGGLVFGMGAAVNRGCAFSTLTQLADGQLSMLLTLAGFCGGVAAHVLLLAKQLVAAAESSANALTPSMPWVPALFVLLLAGGIYELFRLWRSRPAGSNFRSLVLSDRYRLSTTALVIGFCSAILYALYGAWAYTSMLGIGVKQAMGSGQSVVAVHLLLFACLLSGMFLSAWHRRGFKLRWGSPVAWISRLAGGFLMGLGAALVPGGNFVLILNGIPNLSPHALPAYFSMIAGILFVLVMMRGSGGEVPVVNCRGDVLPPE